jgi:hypothetical protein
VKKVFLTWNEWSIFPVTYIQGLQSLFSMTETEYQMMLQQVKEATANNNNNNNNNMETKESIWETLRKQAKVYAIPIYELSTIEEIQYKIQFIQRKSNINVPPPLSTKMDIRGEDLYNETNTMNVDDNDDDVVDGIPVNLPVFTNTTTTTTHPPIDDDIDGVPLAGVVGVGNAAYHNDDDDIDGMPFNSAYNDDDVDGIPMDFEIESTTIIHPLPPPPATVFNDDIDDIDGVPL